MRLEKERSSGKHQHLMFRPLSYHAPFLAILCSIHSILPVYLFLYLWVFDFCGHRHIALDPTHVLRGGAPGQSRGNVSGVDLHVCVEVRALIGLQGTPVGSGCFEGFALIYIYICENISINIMNKE